METAQSWGVARAVGRERRDGPGACAAALERRAGPRPRREGGHAKKQERRCWEQAKQALFPVKLRRGRDFRPSLLSPP